MLSDARMVRKPLSKIIQYLEKANAGDEAKRETNRKKNPLFLAKMKSKNKAIFVLFI